MGCVCVCLIMLFMCLKVGWGAVVLSTILNMRISVWVCMCNSCVGRMYLHVWVCMCLRVWVCTCMRVPVTYVFACMGLNVYACVDNFFKFQFYQCIGIFVVVFKIFNPSASNKVFSLSVICSPVILTE